MQRRKWLPRLVNLAVFIVLEIASLHLLASNAPLQRIWVTRGAHVFMGKVWGATQSVRNYFSLAARNRELALENHALLEELERSREQLRRIQADSSRVEGGPGFSMIPAEVVKISRNKQHNYLILDRGFADGVQEKSGIITLKGAVGVIEAVSEHYSYALSFQNTDISISARLGTGGSTGLLIWDGIRPDGAVLKEIPLQNRYQPGDTVYTSGHSLLFPPDIPLGIAGNAKVVNGATHEIAVRLFQDFRAIRFVSIVHNQAMAEIEGYDL